MYVVNSLFFSISRSITLFHLPCKAETERNLNFEDESPTEDESPAEDEYATKGDLRFEVGRLEQEVRDGDENALVLQMKQIEDLKKQIEGLERYAERLRSGQLRFALQSKRMAANAQAVGFLLFLIIPVTLIIAWFWFHN